MTNAQHPFHKHTLRCVMCWGMGIQMWFTTSVGNLWPLLRATFQAPLCHELITIHRMIIKLFNNLFAEKLEMGDFD